MISTQTNTKDNIFEQSVLRFFKDRFRILLIIHFFSESNDNQDYPRLFYGEIKVQAIDFFIRNPDYLAFELLSIAERKPDCLSKVKSIVRKIYNDSEPVIRKQEMEKFFYGAFEDIDDVIAFLVSRGLLKYESKRRVNMTVAEKHYYVSAKGNEVIMRARAEIPLAKWYFERCSVIEEFLGGATGSELKARQYQVEEYSNTTYKAKIQQINELVDEKFYSLFKEHL